MARPRQGRKDKKPDSERVEERSPDQIELTEIGASRLSKLARLDEKELVGRSVGELQKALRWRIDPQLLLFRRVCGRVVKKDPITGVEHPVPFATVHVEDTDCGLLGYFPPGWPYGWYFPFFCRREELASVKTDACGRFCVFIPRFDIDWILRFRRLRVCFPIIFERPRLIDILEHLPRPIEKWPPFRPPKPEPDPPGPLLQNGGFRLRRAAGVLGHEAVERLGALELAGEFGADSERQLELVSESPTLPLPPPLPPELGEKLEREGFESLLTEASGLEAKERERLLPELSQLDPRRFIGPFWRCRDVILPQWVPIFDVPDITFRVTQDVDGDGDEETIYSEGYFDVRWNAGSIPPVKLLASQIAVSAPDCDGPKVPCADEPAIVLAGRYPLHNPAGPPPYQDNGTGYAQRPNRPHPSALIGDPPPNPIATAPYMGTVSLYGCNHNLGGQYYRLLYRHESDPSTQLPFLGHSWSLSRLGPGGVLQQLPVAPDGQGWYDVLDPNDGWLPTHLLLDWPSGAYSDGRYEIVLELGDGSKNPVGQSDPVSIYADNSTPAGSFTGLGWRPSGTGGWTELGLFCPVIFRPQGQAIDIRVDYQASAHHLRHAQLYAGGCGGPAPATLAAPGWSEPPSPAFVAGVSQSPYEHWHTGSTDNALARKAIFSLTGSAPQGSYGFSLYVASRAFNPAGGDSGPTVDWDPYNPVYLWRWTQIDVAVIDS